VRSHAAPRSARSRLLAPALILLAVAAVAAAVLLSGGDGDQAQPGGDQGQAGGSGQEQAQTPTESTPTESEPSESEPAPEDTAPAETAPSEPDEPARAEPGIDPARGAQLNEQGFALMGQGDYAGAVPVLQEAVASWAEDSGDINYAYALYNLGVSLNRTGRAAEAIPYLEKRLNWSNQRGVVMKELRLARANAG
jgi:tetratricopeptide (TPR) repeat protein